MSVYKQEDGHGNSIIYMDTDGYITSTLGNPEEGANRIRKMASFKCRPDDVFICAPMKSAEYQSWFEYVLEWEELMANNPELPVHLIYYEDLKEDSLKEICRLGRFLGIEDKDGLFEAISEKCQFENMVQDKQQYQAPDGASIVDGFTFYRKGDIGDWKNWFTVAQNEMFDEIYRNKMKDSKHKFRYSRKNKS
ncbi:sulfotransferase 1E1-like [Mercenaria mercenaria]|uniref:sulfotransferase 1E1-like n=1 Tax=Mercenaria mercenaria TaxID=6596 RepID=UPI00234F10D5|nr:sulfotransferase 1E1-like [Mercenaria mercenaria]